jgi:hypothetical protein
MGVVTVEIVIKSYRLGRKKRGTSKRQDQSNITAKLNKLWILAVGKLLILYHDRQNFTCKSSRPLILERDVTHLHNSKVSLSLRVSTILSPKQPQQNGLKVCLKQ